jgi:hypothetical protein
MVPEPGSSALPCRERGGLVRSRRARGDARATRGPLRWPRRSRGGACRLRPQRALHRLDAPRPGLCALGCFFETERGVMLTPGGEASLLAGRPLWIASPVSAPVPDPIARAILTRHAAARGGVADPAAITVEEAGFGHLDKLRAGDDGAWLSFHNFGGGRSARRGARPRLRLDRLRGAAELLGPQAFHLAGFRRARASGGGGAAGGGGPRRGSAQGQPGARSRDLGCPLG